MSPEPPIDVAENDLPAGMGSMFYYTTNFPLFSFLLLIISVRDMPWLGFQLSQSCSFKRSRSVLSSAWRQGSFICGVESVYKRCYCYSSRKACRRLAYYPCYPVLVGMACSGLVGTALVSRQAQKSNRIYHISSILSIFRPCFSFLSVLSMSTRSIDLFLYSHFNHGTTAPLP